MRPVRRNPLTSLRLGSPAWTLFSALVLVAVATTLVGLALREHPADRLADLQVYRGAVERQVRLGDLYGYRRWNGDTFNYPPFAALILLPLMALPWLPTALIWEFGTCAALAFVVRRVAILNGRTALSYTFLGTAAVLAMAPMRSNIFFGQISAVIFCVTALDLLAPGSRRSGVGVGIASAIKLTPLLFVPYLLVTR